jgi:hypothetical protein
MATAQQRLLSSGDAVAAALTRSEAYGASAGTVEVRETHSSWVFLVGDRAYKLKKPITLPFVDYGTAERRRAMCEEDVRLNLRLAPDVYLGTRAVVATAGGVVLAPRAIPTRSTTWWRCDGSTRIERWRRACRTAGSTTRR